MLGDIHFLAVTLAISRHRCHCYTFQAGVEFSQYMSTPNAGNDDAPVKTASRSIWTSRESNGVNQAARPGACIRVGLPVGHSAARTCSCIARTPPTVPAVQ